MVIHLCEAMNFVLGLPTFWYWGPSLGNVEPNLLKSLKRIYYQIWMCFTREFWRRHLPPIRLKVSWLWRRHSHQIWMYFTHGLMSLFRRHLDVFYHPIRMHFTWRFVTLWRRHFPSYLDEFYPWFDVSLSPLFGCILSPNSNAFYPKFRGFLAPPPVHGYLELDLLNIHVQVTIKCGHILPEIPWQFDAFSFTEIHTFVWNIWIEDLFHKRRKLRYRSQIFLAQGARTRRGEKASNLPAKCQIFVLNQHWTLRQNFSRFLGKIQPSKVSKKCQVHVKKAFLFQVLLKLDLGLWQH